MPKIETKTRNSRPHFLNTTGTSTDWWDDQQRKEDEHLTSIPSQVYEACITISVPTCKFTVETFPPLPTLSPYISDSILIRLILRMNPPIKHARLKIHNDRIIGTYLKYISSRIKISNWNDMDFPWRCICVSRYWDSIKTVLQSPDIKYLNWGKTIPMMWCESVHPRGTKNWQE